MCLPWHDKDADLLRHLHRGITSATHRLKHHIVKPSTSVKCWSAQLPRLYTALRVCPARFLRLTRVELARRYGLICRARSAFAARPPPLARKEDVAVPKRSGGRRRSLRGKCRQNRAWCCRGTDPARLHPIGDTISARLLCAVPPPESSPPLSEFSIAAACSGPP